MAVYSRQAGAVRPTGIRRRLRPRYVDVIQGQYGQATQQVLQDKARELQENQFKQNIQLQRDQFQHQKDVARQRAKSERRAAGIQTAQLGLNVMDRIKGSFLDKTFKVGVPGTGGKSLSLNTGSLIPAAAIGTGAAMAFGGKDEKWEKVALGVGSGLAADYLIGGGNSILGSFLGAIPGLG